MKTTAQTTASSQAPDAAEKPAPSKLPFNIVIAYDTFASGQHAVETCHRLLCESGNNFTVRVKTWSFSLLRNTVANLTAATDAAKAQMVVIATSSDDLPPSVKKWLEAWLVWKGTRRGMLVALLNNADANNDSLPAETYLRSAAANGGMEFLLEKSGHTEESRMFFPK